MMTRLGEMSRVVLEKPVMVRSVFRLMQVSAKADVTLGRFTVYQPCQSAALTLALLPEIAVALLCGTRLCNCLCSC